MLRIIAHRGMGPTNRVFINKNIPAGILPENTLPAFKQALEEGATGIELDVFLTKNNVVVVCHDDELDRNIDGVHDNWSGAAELQYGRISEHTYQALQKYDVGHGERIPTLNDVIELVLQYNARYNKLTNKNLLINIELKGNPEVADAVSDIVSQFVHSQKNSLTFDDFIINSFDKACLLRMRAVNPKLAVFLGFKSREVLGSDRVCEISPEWVPYAKLDGRIIIAADKPVVKQEIHGPTFMRGLRSAMSDGIMAIDLVSSDVSEHVCANCKHYGLTLNVATNAIRLRHQAIALDPRNGKKSDEQLEVEEIQRLYRLAKDYNITILFKADNPKRAIAAVRALEQPKQVEKPLRLLAQPRAEKAEIRAGEQELPRPSVAEGKRFGPVCYKPMS